MTKNLMKTFLEEKGAVHDPQAKAMIEKIREGYLKNRGTKHMKKKSFSPSSLVYGHGACPRYWNIAFSGADFEDDADAYAVANMTSGTMSHERLQKAMKDSGIMVEDEVIVINDDPPIYGYADGIIDWEGEFFVVEIKTMRSESFEYRKNSKPPTYHLEQILLYMKVLKMSRGVLIYENKNSHDLHIVPVEISDEYIDWVNGAFDWMKEVRKAWEDKILPQKPYRSNSKICKKCPVKETCFSMDKGDVKINPMEHLSK